MQHIARDRENNAEILETESSVKRILKRSETVVGWQLGERELEW